MDIIGYLFFGIIILAIVAYLFYILRVAIIIGTFLLGIYLIFFTDYLVLGCLSLVVWLVISCTVEKDVKRKSQKKNGGFFLFSNSIVQSKQKAAYSSSSNLSYILLWLVPLFWPVLIFQTFFRDKQAGKQNEYDYEQHLKSNGK